MEPTENGNQNLPKVQKSVLGQEKKRCTVEGCDRIITAKGLCTVHYQRVRKNGSIALKRRQDGEGSVVNSGYISFWNGGDRKLGHIIVAETALGKSLPKGAVVHHVDGNKGNNDRENLVICENAKYHHLLHIREMAYRETGDYNKRKCSYCKEYDAKENLTSYSEETKYFHSECKRSYQKRKYAEKRAD